MFEVNVWGRVRVTQAFAALLMRAKGTIINIGSIAAYYPSVWKGIYGASCAAQHHLNDVQRIEMEPFHVTVILVRSRLPQSFTLSLTKNRLLQERLKVISLITYRRRESAIIPSTHPEDRQSKHGRTERPRETTSLRLKYTQIKLLRMP